MIIEIEDEVPCPSQETTKMEQDSNEDITQKLQRMFQSEIMKLKNGDSELEKMKNILEEKENEIKSLKIASEKNIKDITERYEKQIEDMEKEFEKKLSEFQHNPRTVDDITALMVKQYETSELDQITIAENIFDDSEIELIKKLAQDLPSSAGTVGKSTVDEQMRKSTVKWFDRHDPRYNFMYVKICQAVINANKKKYHVNLSGMTEAIQFTVYNTSNGPNFYHFHSDMGKVSAHRKLSISIQLSDEKDYEGGELQFQIVREPFSVTKKKGTAIIFPSFLQHRVLPVTKGERLSLVCWISGPPYR